VWYFLGLNINQRTAPQQNNNMRISKDALRTIADETIQAVAKGFYMNNGTRVNIAPLVTYARDNTILIRATDSVNVDIPKHDNVKVDVQLATTLQAVQDALTDDPTANIAALNFASAKNPGGGFLKGSSAQEESIARTSSLYECINSNHVYQYYADNARNKDCLYTHHIIYSPSVPVFRSDSCSPGEYLDTPYTCSFITSPAINYKHASERVDDHNLIMQTFYDRLEKVLSIAVANNVDTIVLGAWGCGVFGCSRFDTGYMFGHFLIKENAKFKHAFKRVIFAINEEKALEEFSEGLNSDKPRPTPTRSEGTSGRGGRGGKNKISGGRDRKEAHRKKYETKFE
jgi:uncharacterized protein (TIGR02452 family)